MSAVLLNSTPAAQAQPLDVLAANTAEPGGFADALAAEQAGAPAALVAEPLPAPAAEPEVATPVLSPELLALIAAETVPAPLLPLPPDLPSAGITAPVSVATPPADEAGADEPPADEHRPALDAQTSYALAALGLWQPPAEAVAQAIAPTQPRAEPRTGPSFALPFEAAGAGQSALPTAQAVPVVSATAAPSSDTGAAADEAVPEGAAAPAVKPAAAPSSGSEGAPLVPALNLVGLAGLRPAAPADAAGATLRLPNGEPTQWQQPLLQALGDRLQLQIATRSEQAVIRLEPPLMGRVDIAIRQQAGELQVRLSATHVEVTRQLQQVSEGLRQELAQRHSGDVSVQVAQGSRDSADARPFGRDAQSQQQAQQEQQEGREQQQRRPGRALSEAEGGQGHHGRFAATLAGTQPS